MKLLKSTLKTCKSKHNFSYVNFNEVNCNTIIIILAIIGQYHIKLHIRVNIEQETLSGGDLSKGFHISL